MEMLWIRHGQGEHLLDYPNRLDTLHPGLTEKGRAQIKQLGERLSFREDDLMLVSPTRRTIESAMLLHPGAFQVTPAVGPRMFPQDPLLRPLKCDAIYTREELFHMYGNVPVLELGMENWTTGINQIEQVQFETNARSLLAWMRQAARRIVILSHDGTITNYRMLLGERGLSRQDFLGEAGVYRMNVP